MNIKTYPLQFTERQLDEIRDAAEQNKTSMKSFMLAAINAAVRVTNENKEGE